MGYAIFTNRQEAEEHIDQMFGWPDARPVQCYLPDSPEADSEGEVWIICCDEAANLYLMDDGYVG